MMSKLSADHVTRASLAFLLIAGVCSCTQGGGGPTQGPGCEHYRIPVAQGMLPDGLDEISGICASSTPGMLWMHSDSGSGPEVYAVDIESGALVATVTLALDWPYDWEDISAGPCGPDRDDRCLFIGDIGNNETRELLGFQLLIHRFVEPDPADGNQEIVDVDTMAFRYSDHVRHDAEALVSDNLGRVFILTKDPGSVFWLFGAPFARSDQPVELTSYGQFDVSSMHNGEPTKITAADFDSGTNRLLVRGWVGMLEYVLPWGRDLTTMQGITPRIVPCAEEPQGESVCYGNDGYYQVSEGVHQPVYFIGCDKSEETL